MKYVKIDIISDNKKELETIVNKLLTKKLTNNTNIIKTDSYSLNNNKIINTNNYILSFITRYKSLDEIYKLVDDKNNILITEDITINKNYKDKFEDSTNTTVFL